MEKFDYSKVKLYVATPMFGRKCFECYYYSMLNLQKWCIEKGVSYQFATVSHDSLITRARNTLVAKFMDSPHDFTHMFFIDADIEFAVENVKRLIEKDEEVVCGVYPKKALYYDDLREALLDDPDISNEDLLDSALKYNININPKGFNASINGFIEGEELATGFMMIKREVIIKMQKAYPQYKYTYDIDSSNQRETDKNRSSENHYDLFRCFIGEKDNRYYSEDYGFSQLWRAIGGKIYADILSALGHEGFMTYKGRFVTQILKDFQKKEVKSGKKKKNT